MKKIPSDLEILKAIYKRYNTSYKEYAQKEPDRITRVRVPIDIGKVAEDCGVQEDMIFGRLYYHFNKKYSYMDENGNRTTFFSSLKFEGLSVNFPLVLSILADLEHENKSFNTVITVSALALGISILALVLSVVL